MYIGFVEYFKCSKSIITIPSIEHSLTSTHESLKHAFALKNLLSEQASVRTLHDHSTTQVVHLRWHGVASLSHNSRAVKIPKPFSAAA